MRVRILRVLPVALAVMFLVPAGFMRADVLYSNISPAGTALNSYYDVGATSSGTEVNAFPFIPSQTAVLTGADLVLAGLVSTSPLTVYIESNSGTGQPGTILDTLTQSGSYGPLSTFSTVPVVPVVDFTCSGTCATLEAGTTYWIVGQNTVTASTAAWIYDKNSDLTGTWYYNYTDSATGPWTTATNGNCPFTDPTAPPCIGEFDVTGTPTAVPTPEPASLALVGSGLVGIAAALRRRTARR